MFEENVVNDTHEPNVEVQETEVVEESTDSVPSEVAPEAEKPVQTPEENAKFKEIRLQTEQKIREAEQKAQDKLIAEMYGESHGIYTKADYDKAVKEQKEREMLERMRTEEVDPTEIKNALYKEWESSDPRIKEYEQIKAETYTQNQLKELNEELKELDLGIEIKTLDDLVKLDNSEKIIDYVSKGKTLSEAYFLANKKTLIQKEAEKVRNDTINKIKQNGEASPGSLADTGQTAATFTKEQVDNMSMEEVKKNYDLILKSMKSW